MRDFIRYRSLAAAFRPERALQYLWRVMPIGSFPLRLTLDIVTPPRFAYGFYHAALTAKRLGIPKISAIEVGVAGGSGLVALERISKAVERELETKLDIY